jgi:hypothetical protein
MTMAKVLALYRKPADPAAFDRYYRDVHVPIAKKVPGLRRYEISRGEIGMLGGRAPYHLIAVLSFDSLPLCRPRSRRLKARRPPPTSATSRRAGSKSISRTWRKFESALGRHDDGCDGCGHRRRHRSPRDPGADEVRGPQGHGMIKLDAMESPFSLPRPCARESAPPPPMCL